VSQQIEFGSKEAADQFRDDQQEYLCPIDDDKRQKTVAVVSDAPDHVVERAEIEAASGRSERSGDGGQVALTDHERNEIDFSEERASVPHARSVKGIARSEGVDDWLAYYDTSLTVDEHRDVMERAAQEGGGRRLDENDSADDRLADAEAAMGGQCDHARDHCEHGDSDACEFLTEACGFDEDAVEEILSEEQGDPARGDLPGEVYGAFQKLWNQYRAALADAKEAAAAINEIRQQYGQDPLAMEELGDRPITKEDIDA
jgi:hypothetical protein